jgi:hypothetical protein
MRRKRAVHHEYGRFALRYAFVAVTALLTGMAVPAAAADPFAKPLKDCHPCRFSPGPGQPDFDLTFVFSGADEQKALTGFDIAQVGSQQTQRLTFGPLAVSDFPDGYTLDGTDMNFDGFRDLSVVTLVAADNTDARYWLYQPARHDFVPLQRVGDGDDNDVVLTPGDDHELICHVKGDAVEYTNYSYRVSGQRAVAVRKQGVAVEGPLIVDATYDLSVTPNRVVHRTTIGFVGDSPARTDFIRNLEAASKQANELYRHGNSAGAAAAIASVVGDKQMEMVTSSYPIKDDPTDLKLVGEFNDYGFYLEQAGRPKDAIGVLSSVVDVDENRTVAYLNLADAQYGAGQVGDARSNYAAYRKRMEAAGKLALVPPRVAERMH